MIREPKEIDNFSARLRHSVNTRRIPAKALAGERNEVPRNPARQEYQRSGTS
jgi:hypothetical protein